MSTTSTPKQDRRQLGGFDRFATAVSGAVSKAWFFALCVAMVLIWAPSFFVFQNVDTWQLIINTVTTIVTFLLVALLQNTQSRDMRAVHNKLNAVAEGLADLMETFEGVDEGMAAHIDELRDAVGLEHREGS